MAKKYYMNEEFRYLLQKKMTNMNLLSQNTGITQSTIYRIIKGETEPRPSTLHTIAEALKVDVARDRQGIYFIEKENEDNVNVVMENENNYTALNSEQKLLLSLFSQCDSETRLYILGILRKLITKIMKG